MRWKDKIEVALSSGLIGVLAQEAQALLMANYVSKKVDCERCFSTAAYVGIKRCSRHDKISDALILFLKTPKRISINNIYVFEIFWDTDFCSPES